MKTNTKTSFRRIALLSALLILLVTMLSGCMGSGTQSVSFSVDESIIGDRVDNKDNYTHTLDRTTLKSWAAVLVKTYNSKDFDTRELLVAASRGYNMLEEGFTETDKDFPKLEKFSVDGLKALMEKANERAGDNGVDLRTVKWEKITQDDIDTLVASIQTKINTTPGSGLFDVLLGGIGKFLALLTNTLGFGHYLVGICIFAVIIEVIMLFLFGIKQQKNTIRQANLRPKEMAIRNKYKGRNDQVTMQKMQQEIQEFYQRENFSPYSGCLPLLVQMPIIMALYYIVIDPLHYVLGQSTQVSAALVEYYTASPAAGGLGGILASNRSTIAVLAELKDNFAGAIEGLREFAYFSNGQNVFDSLTGISIPNFNIGPFNFGLIPSFSNFDVLLLVPVLTFVSYYITTKLNRKFMVQPTAAGGPDERQVACSNNIMDITMPAMSTVFTFAVPAVVGVYWIFRSLVGLLKQFILSRVMPLPKFTEEDYKRAAKEMAGKQHVNKKSSNRVGNVRSLHHIDDEDFEDTRERALARKAAIEERERREKEENEKKSIFGGATLKKDDKNPTEPEKAEEENKADGDDKNSN